MKPTALKITMTKDEYRNLLNGIRKDSNIKLLYDQEEIQWKMEQERIQMINAIHKDNDKVVPFDPYKGEKLSAIASVFSSSEYQQKKEEEARIDELEEMLKEYDNVKVFDPSKRVK